MIPDRLGTMHFQGSSRVWVFSLGAEFYGGDGAFGGALWHLYWAAEGTCGH